MKTGLPGISGRGQGRPAERTGGARPKQRPDSRRHDRQGTATAKGTRAGAEGGPRRTGGGLGLSRSGAVTGHRPDATTLTVSYAAQDCALKDLIRRFASHAAGGLESLVLLGPYPAGYRPHVLTVPPGLPGPPGAGWGPLALEHSDTSIW